MTAAPSPSPQISIQESAEVVEPPDQDHPVSLIVRNFAWRATGFSSSLPKKLLKRFPNRPIGIPSDVRSALDDFIWTEIWGDGKRFNSNSTYCDDENKKNRDGCQWCSYSNIWIIFF